MCSYKMYEIFVYKHVLVYVYYWILNGLADCIETWHGGLCHSPDDFGTSFDYTPLKNWNNFTWNF